MEREGSALGLEMRLLDNMGVGREEWKLKT
jgi:hypothetical protein